MLSTRQGMGPHQDASLVVGQVVVVILWEALVQVAFREVNGAQAGGFQTLEEEVVDQRVVIALIVHVVCMRHLLTRPALPEEIKVQLGRL